jgi:DNA-binding NarL/FixJ family response regulator
LCRQISPDVVLIDPGLVPGDLAGYIAELRSELPRAEVLLFGDSVDGELLGQLRHVGVSGGMKPSVSSEEFVRRTAAAAERACAWCTFAMQRLKEQDWAIVDRLAEGQTNKEIAQANHSAEGTIEGKVTLISRIVGVEGRECVGNWWLDLCRTGRR